MVLLLLIEPLELYALFLRLNLRILFDYHGMVFSCQFDQLEQSGAFILKVFLLTFFVFVFHITPLVAISGLAGVVFVVLTEASPGVEIVPETEEFVELSYGHGGHQEIGHGLLLAPHVVAFEDF